MPVYEYRCSECGKRFERLQSFRAERQQSCPECGSESERLLSLGSFILKGGGWYATSQRQEKKTSSETSEACTTCSEKESCPASQSTQ